ncbi:MAG: hypothetical protein ABSC93_01480 [Bryobacteraceae bacterium]
MLGQPRAVAAFAFGTSIAGPGFNLFALGQPGSGKTTLIRDYLEHAPSRQSDGGARYPARRGTRPHEPTSNRRGFSAPEVPGGLLLVPATGGKRLNKQKLKRLTPEEREELCARDARA